MPGTALITGAGTRIGQALGVCLGKQGFAVAVHCHASRAGAEQTIAAIRACGGRGELVQADLCNEDETAQLIAAAAAKLGGPITVLVNNAAQFTPDTAGEHSRHDWDAHMSLNLRAPVRLAQGMAQQPGISGQIINITDQRSYDPEYFTYSLSKLALGNATVALAQAFAPFIRVNAIAPGAILPASHESSQHFTDIAGARLLRHSPGVTDLAGALIYLLEAPALTGQTLLVDSGLHMSGPSLRHGSFISSSRQSRHLTLERLELDVEIGVEPDEFGITQPIICSLQVELDPSALDDNIANTVDYAKLAELIRQTAGQRRFNLLESLADSLAVAILALPRILAVRLELAKPKVGESVGAMPSIVVTRRRL